MGVFYTNRNRIHNLEKENGQIRKIVYGDRGMLNLVDTNTCKCHRDEVFTAIRRGETVSEMIMKKIEELNKNVLILMISLNVRSPNGMSIEGGEDKI